MFCEIQENIGKFGDKYSRPAMFSSYFPNFAFASVGDPRHFGAVLDRDPHL
jgi:hypothetical protein